MIDTQALRRKILDAAISGKLTQQLPEDGNAEDLYKEIQAEKQRLIKEGKLKKDKPFPEVDDKDVPFKIPENWKWVRLGALLHIESGKNLTTTSMNGGVYPVYGGNGITGYHNQWLIEANTIIIGRVGFYCGSVHVTQQKAWVTDNAFITTYPETSIDKDYLVYVLKYLDLGKDNSNATAQPVISGKRIYPLLFPLAPFAEQKRIVAKIESIFSKLDLIDEEQKKLSDNSIVLRNKLIELGIKGELTEQLIEDGNAEDLYEEIQAEKQRLIKEGKFKKEKSLPEIEAKENPFDIPANWKWVRLSEIGSTMLGKTLNKSLDKGETKPYLCSINVYWSGVDLNLVKEAKFDKQEQSVYRLERGDVLVCEGGDVGRTIIWNSDQEMYYQNALHRVRFFSEGFMPEFFKIVMECYKGIGLIDQNSSGITIKHFVQSALKSMPIPFPPVAEQKRIVEKLDKLLPLCDAMSKDIAGGEAV